MNSRRGSLTGPFTRRRIIQAPLAGGLAFAISGGRPALPAAASAQESTDIDPEVVIDLPNDPRTLDPALTYAFGGWSIVHSIYDAPIQFGPDGELQPLAAETFTQVDPTTFELRLRRGLTFHDGSPVTSAAIARGVQHMQESQSQVADLFAVVTAVEEVDELSARIRCSEAAAWLPAQMAVWLPLLPEGVDAATMNTAPVGSGPYRFESYESGSQISLIRNEDYTWPSPKGAPLADRAVFRFVPEPATRVADLLSGASTIIASVPAEQRDAIDGGGARSIDAPTLGSAWIRIATDVPPFDDPRVRQALNYAVDAQAIVDALLGGQGNRLASLFPDERALGFDPALQPFAFDPDKARQLLSAAGVGDGLETALEFATTERQDVVEAIAAMLGEVGIQVTVQATDGATFNERWSDPAAPPLRFATWRPLYDPHSLLSLVFASEGFLSRHSNPRVDDLIRSAAAEVDRDQRNARYQELGRVLTEEPAAIYLWNLSSLYGVASGLEGWTPRGDEYIIPTRGYGQS